MREPASLFEPVDASAPPRGPGGTDGPAATPETWLPTELSRGPWDPGALHGGPVGALVARAVERSTAASPAPGHLIRLTLELLRPVPVAPLTVTAAVTRPGRKVQVVEGAVTTGGQTVARHRAVRLRVDPELDLLGEAGPGEEEPAPFPGPDEAMPAVGFRGTYRGFHNAGAELRVARGGFAERGPSAVWVRLAAPLVPGEEPSPFQRTVAAADFGNGVSSVLPPERYTFINPDLTVFCSRPAVGEWVALEATTTLGAPGVGLAQSVLWDSGSAGPLGRAVQCILVECR